MQILLVENESDLSAYVDSWRRWAQTPLQSPEWLLAWWSAYQNPSMRLAVLVAVDSDGEALGLAPMYFRDHWALGRSLRFLGSGRACTDFQTLLARPGENIAVADAVAQWLIDERHELGWSYIELEGIAANDATIERSSQALQQYRCGVQTHALENTWRVDLSGGWEGVLSRMSRTQRRQSRNLTNRFDKNADLSVSHVRDLDGIDRALEICGDLHGRRWQTAGEQGCFADSQFRTFVESACHALAKRNQVSVSILEDRGSPIATQLFLHDANGNAFQYQSGRDPDRAADSVGRMLALIDTRSACETGASFLDFLRGNEVYKARLGGIASPCLRRRIIAPAVLPRIRGELWKAGRGLKASLAGISLPSRQPPVPESSATDP